MAETSAPNQLEEMMLLAVAEAAKARMKAPPNPWVGAVVETADGLVMGHTQSPGGSHAEIDALDQAGSRAFGSTLYVTLEPCSHHGRTPPCAHAIVKAGVRRVVIALVDPDYRVRGKGIEYLQSHDVEVKVGVGEEAVKAQLAPYLKHRATGLPWVVLKLAITLDGRIASNDGSSNWITGENARKRVQALRSESDAIVVGSNTVMVDDPQLTVRIPGTSRSPRRIVFGAIPSGARVLPAEEYFGSPSVLLEVLGKEDVLQVLVEGGAHLAKSFLDSDLIDQFVFHIAPALHGGEDGISAFAGHGSRSVSDLTRLEAKSVISLGNDVEIEAWSLRASKLIKSL
ncbi:MAG: bifunctional diaminohydroxyphosphoribosylaminopyrimidine deaminase/5-amino-6-(5-phosphoribosylamino)uracil reductase RibD [Actinomycetota bacterium]|nr:MAG: bifunctional diaminohydroxyphosphoribosylaminopyrimidine deaminase/5-amino-6-(5-phosphoribosylamino)uracil reductase RibD [Actinomycetota bacterium]